MNYDLNYEGFENYMVARHTHYDGVQYSFRFKNGYGASVIKRDFSYGVKDDLWELAVTKYVRDSDDDTDFYLTYDTPITNDVVGYIDDREIRELLKEIMEL